MDFKDNLNNENSLQVDKIYEGGRFGNAADDPISALVGVGNQGGFRFLGNKEQPLLIVLYTNMDDPDWPDEIDKENGIFTYFGDNKKPGFELHKTPKHGNFLLRYLFEKAHGGEDSRLSVPPILVFTKAGTYRDIRFLGLAVPGAQNLNSINDLIAVWKIKDGNRYQNYQAKFTILNVPSVEKSWLSDARQNNILSKNCPVAWRDWVKSGVYKPLKAVPVINYRNKNEQLPDSDLGKELIETIYNFFEGDPFKFEICAAKIAEILLPNIVSIDVTRPTRDGGRDAIGKYRIGDSESSVLVDFALEAKCYHSNNPVGVKELSRLISRLRHRQFGILVTTSYLALQAYQEIKEDEHPILIVCGKDIVRVLINAGINSNESLLKWLVSL
jgi:hypothetical protein